MLSMELDEIVLLHAESVGIDTTEGKVLLELIQMLAIEVLEQSNSNKEA